MGTKKRGQTHKVRPLIFTSYFFIQARQRFTILSFDNEVVELLILD
jgi:hypothetical protein